MKTFRRYLIAFTLAFLTIGSGVGWSGVAEYEGVTATVIKKTTTVSDGRKILYPATDNPELTVLTVEIPVGGETGWHLHPIPVYAYMLSGSITVETKDGQQYHFREGDAIIEMVDTPHNGKNNGDIPAKLVVFYLGIENSPTTIKVNQE